MGTASTVTSIRQEVILQDPERFGQRTYVVRVPDIYDQAELRRRIKARGGKVLDPSVMASKLRRGVEAIFREQGEEEEADRYLKVLDDLVDRSEIIAGYQVAGDEVPQDLIDEVVALSEDADEIATVVARAYAPYAAAIADSDYWQDLMKIEMIRMLVTRIGEPWDHPDKGTGEHVLWRAKREGRARLLPVEALQDIPQGHLASLQMEIMGLFAPGEVQVKN